MGKGLGEERAKNGKEDDREGEWKESQSGGYMGGGTRRYE